VVVDATVVDNGGNVLAVVATAGVSEEPQPVATTAIAPIMPNVRIDPAITASKASKRA
jgi:hypothetical protein